MADNRSYKIAWAAGFLDADGCFSLLRQRSKGCKTSTCRPVISATQVRAAPLLVLMELFGGAVREARTAQGKPVFMWEVTGAERLIGILPSLIPHLFLKKREAEVILEYAFTMGQRGRILTDEQIAQREAIVERFAEARESR